jgi:REP element-mobilizing transposase RayT
MEKYKNKYRIKSARLDGYDYTRDGIYFVTICTKNREHFFGEIRNGAIILNGAGFIVNNFWLAIPNNFPFVILDEYVIMPNHVHGIIIIDNEKSFCRDAIYRVSTNDVKPRNDIFMNNHVLDAMNRVSTHRPNLKQTDAMNRVSTGGATGKHNPMGKNSLGEIIRRYKGRCKYEIVNPNFNWQTRFYDHLIRDGKSLQKIRNYIINNPSDWELDKNNLENLWM